ncbi:GMC oxidoreductase-domain-containing protein [Mycena leptocephala]|nr:GMC oxidoreductase-domain-containing protein [Mycena leptocephala]
MMTISRIVFSVLLLVSHLATRSSGSPVVQTTYVVVGGGTAGLAVATRLSENAVNTVIVLESGSDGFNNPNIGNLSFASIQSLPGSSVDWNYTSVPLKFASNQTIAEPRGKVLGGSFAINGALFTCPNKIDLDLWESAFGATGWAGCSSVKGQEHLDSKKFQLSPSFRTWNI